MSLVESDYTVSKCHTMSENSTEHTTSSLLEYKYEPLPKSQNGERWIRVLDLFPSTDREEPVRGRLRTILLNESSRYNAISYVWGDAIDNTATVLVKDNDTQSQFYSNKVRKNLLEGLRVFRLANQERTLWVDALCINQEDRDERSQQVGLMGLIFWLAESVLIWLGRDERQIAGQTFNYMQPISWGYFHSKDPNHKRPRSSAETEALDARIWSGIKELYCNPWFERVWVQQEIGLAKKARFFWGEANCCHHDVLGFDLWLEQAGELPVKRFNIDRGVLRGTRSHWISYGRSTREAWGDHRVKFMTLRPFLATLIEGAHCKATDPRDHIYAFLGHPSARRQYAYRPEQQINYLKLIEEAREALVKPDYGKTVDEVYLETAVALFNQQRDMRVLGAVRHTEESLARDYPSWVPRWDAIRDQRPIGAIPFDSYPGIVLENFPATWKIDRRPPTYCIRASCTVSGLVYQVINRLFDFNDGSAWMQQHIRGRRFFRTNSEQDGIAPSVARPGDIIVLVLVSYAPCILRHVEGEEYKFIGTCHVYGIMDRMSQIVNNDRSNIKKFTLI
ncbi:heterokaryon incompatibility protein-domain-containing protein [Xylaria flabelliformis]|nr:heterokaryon incompatibility protein-domain-containing protein [Xylaria flabelliformis]